MTLDEAIGELNKLRGVIGGDAKLTIREIPGDQYSPVVIKEAKSTCWWRETDRNNPVRITTNYFAFSEQELEPL